MKRRKDEEVERSKKAEELQRTASAEGRTDSARDSVVGRRRDCVGGKRAAARNKHYDESDGKIIESAEPIGNLQDETEIKKKWYLQK